MKSTPRFFSESTACRPTAGLVMASDAGKLTFGAGPHAIVEHWIGRREGRWLRLTRSGVGDGRVLLTDDGRLVGRLNRLDVTGDLHLSPQQ